MKFHELYIPARLRADHTANGGRGLRRFTARASDGRIIRVMSALEPAGKREAVIRHTSVSVAETHGIDEPPCRVPTDEEFNAAVLLTFEHGEWIEEPKPSTTGIRHAWDKEQ